MGKGVERIRREIAEIIDRQLATGLPVTPSGIAAELLGRHPIEGVNRELFIFSLRSLVHEMLGRPTNDGEFAPVTLEEWERRKSELGISA